MISNLFSITSSDGKLNQTPSGEFTQTSTFPSDNTTLMKGTSDLTCINDGIAGCYSSQNINTPVYFIKENGEPAITHMSDGKNTAFLGFGPVKLKGSTIYGYIITKEVVPNHPGTGRSEESYVINFITSPNYKLPEPTYDGWGLTGVNFTASNKLWHGYSIEGVTSTDAPTRIAFGPVIWNYYDRDQYYNLSVAYITVIDGVLAVSQFLVTKNSTVNYQHTENAKYVELYGSRKITILNSDVIIPSLEDRVDQLEAQVANLPSDIDAAFALAVDKVSKIFVSR